MIENDESSQISSASISYNAVLVQTFNEKTYHDEFELKEKNDKESDIFSMTNLTHTSEISQTENVYFGYTPNSNLFYVVLTADLDELKKLLLYPNNIKDYEGRNLLQVACKEGFYDKVEYMLSIGFNIFINSINNEGETALHECVRYGYKNIIELLLKNNINYKIRNNDGTNALHYAAMYKHIEIFQYFIHSNLFNIYEKNNSKLNIFHIACLNDNYIIVEYLISIGYDINILVDNNNTTVLDICVREGNEKIINLLLKSNININIRSIDQGRTSLHYSSEMNQLNILKYFINNNIYNNIYDIDNDGNNILHIACIEGNYNIIEYLLSIGYNINITNHQNFSSLHYSVINGLMKTIILLLENNIDIHIRTNEYGRLALHLSSEFNQLHILQYFINNNIYNNIYDIDNDYNNILHLACLKGNINIIKYLISIEYNINITNCNNESSLHYCIINGNMNIFQLLLYYDINIYIKSIDKGRTALHYISLFNQLDILKYIINNNIYNNIYDIDNDGNNILHIACLEDNYNIVEYLISIDYNINILNHYNLTCLHCSVMNGNIQIVNILINNNIDINIISTNNCRSALHYSSYYNQLDILKYFINNNIYNNIYDIDIDGNNILHLACWKDHSNIIEYLLSIGYDINKTNINNLSPLHYCIINGNINIIKLLIKEHIDIHIRTNKHGRSALHYSVEYNQLNILKYFIDNNIYNNIYDIDNDGMNILHLACLVGNYDIVEYLLSIEYDINNTDHSNWTALHFSVSEGYHSIVNLLIEYNININMKDLKHGRSALHYSCEFNQLDILKYFIDNNIYNNIYDIDNDGNNILHLAYMKRNNDIIEYLLSIGYDNTIPNNSYLKAFELPIKKSIEMHIFH